MFIGIIIINIIIIIIIITINIIPIIKCCCAMSVKFKSPTPKQFITSTYHFPAMPPKATKSAPSNSRPTHCQSRHWDAHATVKRKCSSRTRTLGWIWKVPQSRGRTCSREEDATKRVDVLHGSANACPK